ncbi:MAG: hypothetical protein GQ574_01300 [Crocinitomix sp.]|nr:hypothetical protein [Crocinitomix sp.]
MKKGVQLIFILLVIVSSCRKDDLPSVPDTHHHSGGGVVYFSGKVFDVGSLEPVPNVIVKLYPSGIVPIPDTTDFEGDFLTKYTYLGHDYGEPDVYPGNVEIYVLNDLIWGSTPTGDLPYPKNGDTIFANILVYPMVPLFNNLEITTTPTNTDTWTALNNSSLTGSITYGGEECEIYETYWRLKDRFGNVRGGKRVDPSILWNTTVSGIHTIQCTARVRLREGATGYRSVTIDTSIYVKQRYPAVYGFTEAEHEELRNKFLGDWSAHCLATYTKEWNAEFSFDSTLHYAAEVTENIIGTTTSVFDNGNDAEGFNEKRFLIDSVDVDGIAFGYANFKHSSGSIIPYKFIDLYFSEDEEELYFKIKIGGIDSPTHIQYTLSR